MGVEGGTKREGACIYACVRACAISYRRHGGHAHTPAAQCAAAHGTPPPFECEYDKRKVTYLFVSLAEGALLERLANIFAPAREKPCIELGVIHDEDFARGRLNDDHARREEKIARPEVAIWDRSRRVFTVVPTRSSISHDLGTIVTGASGTGGPALVVKWHLRRGIRFECGEKKGTRRCEKTGVELVKADSADRAPDPPVMEPIHQPQPIVVRLADHDRQEFLGPLKEIVGLSGLVGTWTIGVTRWNLVPDTPKRTLQPLLNISPHEYTCGFADG